MIQNATKIQVEERAMHIESVTTVSTFIITITLAMLHYGIDSVYIYNLQCFLFRIEKHTQNHTLFLRSYCEFV